MLQIFCNSILSYAKNNRVKLKPLRLADTSYHACVFSDSRIESTTVCISCGSNVVSRSIANNDYKQKDKAFSSVSKKGFKKPILGVLEMGGSDNLI
jgi:hypothetical protein